MVGECGIGLEGEWKVEDVRRLYKPEQGMSKRVVPTAEH